MFDVIVNWVNGEMSSELNSTYALAITVVNK